MEFLKRIDAHIHYALPLEPETLIDLMDKTGTEMANLVLVPHRKRLTAVPDALMAKAKYPDRIKICSLYEERDDFLLDRRTGENRVKKKWFDMILQVCFLLTGMIIRWFYVVYIYIPSIK